MKTKSVIVGIILVAVLFSSVWAQNSSRHQVLFERAKYTMETKGDLRAAIKVLEKILEKYPEIRETAAKAQLHIALCKEKLGLQEAQKEYQVVIDSYPEFQQEVTIAKDRLVKLTQLAQSVLRPSTTVRKVWAGPQADNSGSPSPDGVYLSYMDMETGNLAVRDLNTGITQLLTKDGTWDDPMQFTIGSVTITPINLSHPGGGVGYKLTEDDKTFVFLTDNELGYIHEGGLTYQDYAEFSKGADLLLHDAEYTPEEYDNQIDWGHSVYTDTVSLAIEADVTTLGLFHLNQNRTDRQMDAILDVCQRIIDDQGKPLQCVAVDCSMTFEL